jgi:hypothetical protein
MRNIMEKSRPNRPRNGPSSNPFFDRRAFLRTSLATASAGLLGTTAGCMDYLEPNATAFSGSPVSTAGGSTPEREFETYVSKIVEAYGDSGVWGTGRTEPAHSLRYVASWMRRLHLTENGEPYAGDEGNLQATADSALALYEIPGKVDEHGNQSFQLWLWAAARVPESRRKSGLLGNGPVLRNVTTGVGLDSHDVELMSYSPDTRRGDSSVRVRLPVPEEMDPGPDVRFPLHHGTVAPVAGETRVGENGSYTVAWNGEWGRVQGVVGTCELSWNPERNYSLLWTTRLAGGRGQLL